MPTETPPPQAITEPEIRFLAQVIGACLLLFRVATVIAASYSIYHALAGIHGNAETARFYVWLCIGLPPLLPVRWLFSRAGALLVLPGLLLWFGPGQLSDDSDYGYIIRIFATGVALSVLLVWRTVYRLLPSAEALNAAPPAPPPAPAPTRAAATGTPPGDAR
jgi:hypothetical protein